MNEREEGRLLDDTDFLAAAGRGHRAESDPPASAVDYAALARSSAPEAGDLRAVLRQALAAIAAVPGARADALTLPGPQVVLIIALPGPRVVDVDARGEPLIAEGGAVALALADGSEPAIAEARWLTALSPIFHPQISELGRVAWLEPPSGWPQLLAQLGDLAAYRAWSATRNVMNRRAANWAAGREERLPIA